MSEQQRLPDRLARRERDIPVPNPDTPAALVETLADWGAEHRPQQPCGTCGCTLYWTAAGADMCAICLPMPRLTDQSRARIAKLFPRRRTEIINAWDNPPPARTPKKVHPPRSL